MIFRHYSEIDGNDLHNDRKACVWYLQENDSVKSKRQIISRTLYQPIVRSNKHVFHQKSTGNL